VAERRRHEYRGAEAPRGWSLGRGYPLPSVGGVWEGAMPPPKKVFDFESENGDF